MFEIELKRHRCFTYHSFQIRAQRLSGCQFDPAPKPLSVYPLPPLKFILLEKHPPIRLQSCKEESCCLSPGAPHLSEISSAPAARPSRSAVPPPASALNFTLALCTCSKSSLATQSPTELSSYSTQRLQSLCYISHPLFPSSHHYVPALPLPLADNPAIF